MIAFEPFPKIARFSRDVIVTEKIDGTNAQVIIDLVPFGDMSAYELQHSGVPLLYSYTEAPEPQMVAVWAGSRTRIITPGKNTDNYGFAEWVFQHGTELVQLGPGRHFGEWWGKGIQRNYGLNERRFSLFNVGRWRDRHETQHIMHIGLTDKACWAPECCHVAPVMVTGPLAKDYSPLIVSQIMDELLANGSAAAPGFMNPEGVVIFHSAARVLFKKTFEKDDTGKEQAA